MQIESENVVASFLRDSANKFEEHQWDEPRAESADCLRKVSWAR